MNTWHPNGRWGCNTHSLHRSVFYLALSCGQPSSCHESQKCWNRNEGLTMSILDNSSSLIILLANEWSQVTRPNANNVTVLVAGCTNTTEFLFNGERAAQYVRGNKLFHMPFTALNARDVVLVLGLSMQISIFLGICCSPCFSDLLASPTRSVRLS